MLCRNIAIINKGTIVENTSMKSLLSKLNVETFVLDVKLQEQSNMDALNLHSVDYRWIDSHTLEVDVEKAEGLNPVFAQLSEQGIQVMSMRNKSNRLEELFVRLVESAKQAE